MFHYNLTFDKDRMLEIPRVTLTAKYQQRGTSPRAVTSAMSSPSRHRSDAEVGVTVEKVN